MSRTSSTTARTDAAVAKSTAPVATAEMPITIRPIRSTGVMLTLSLRHSPGDEALRDRSRQIDFRWACDWSGHLTNSWREILGSSIIGGRCEGHMKLAISLQQFSLHEFTPFGD